MPLCKCVMHLENSLFVLESTLIPQMLMFLPKGTQQLCDQCNIEPVCELEVSAVEWKATCVLCTGAGGFEYEGVQAGRQTGRWRKSHWRAVTEGPHQGCDQQGTSVVEGLRSSLMVATA